MDLSVIIVNYNTGELLAGCVGSVLASAGFGSIEILVVDNASSDGSLERLPCDSRIILVRHDRNRGFAAGVNAGLRRSRGRFFLLLNPDSWLPPETLARMMTFMDGEPRAALAGCRVEDADGRLQPPCRRRLPRPGASLFKLMGLARLLPGSRLGRSYELGEGGSAQPEPVEAISGSFMMGRRRRLLQNVGLMDERFFLYGEDLDYCLRVKRARLGTYYVPGARVVHHRGQSRRLLPRRSLSEGHRAMRLFYDKHYAWMHLPPLNGLVHLAIRLRLWGMLTLLHLPGVDQWLLGSGPPPRKR